MADQQNAKDPLIVTAPFAPRDTTGKNQLNNAYDQGHWTHQRSLILWELPHLPAGQYIEMYINPQGISYANKKAITSKRTKGGFITQYWGEELEQVQITGVTGDSGIEGINAMMDVYRSEQLALLDMVNNSTTDPTTVKRRQTLASLATSVVMWYQGQGKRGYFLDFSHDESVQQNGTFTYRLSFTVTQTIGTRQNFMPWHRKPWSTTATPNVGESISGGYDISTRLGKLNTESGVLITADGRGWVANSLSDPKYKYPQDTRLIPKNPNVNSGQNAQDANANQEVNTDEFPGAEDRSFGRADANAVSNAAQENTSTIATPIQ